MSTNEKCLIEENRGMSIGWWQPVLFAALAGGMGWGIRGQYGHESGAMIAGVLVSLTLVFLLCPRATSRQVITAVAWTTAAIGFGGSMTYGQTIGLTQNSYLIGNWEALRWGMLGLSIKGGIWIGFAGVFLGMGLGGVRYRARDMMIVMIVAFVAFFLGNYLLGLTHNPASKGLPFLYFSEHGYWNPGREVKSRHENWFGLLLGLLVVIGYSALVRKDRLARNMAFWGILGGAIGFPLGQCVQAFHAWNPGLFSAKAWDANINWWNMMETTFGMSMGGVLGLGLWLNREKIRPVGPASSGYLPILVEWGLILVYVALVVRMDENMLLLFILVILIAGGRWFPWLVVLPITMIPIAGKTVGELTHGTGGVSSLPLALLFLFYVIIPLVLSIGYSIWSFRKGSVGESARAFAGGALLLCAWVYFWLNFAFFRFPWPWSPWTPRTLNGLIFTLCLFGLTAMVWFHNRNRFKNEAA